MNEGGKFRFVIELALAVLIVWLVWREFGGKIVGAVSSVAGSGGGCGGCGGCGGGSSAATGCRGASGPTVIAAQQQIPGSWDNPAPVAIPPAQPVTQPNRPIWQIGFNSPIKTTPIGGVSTGTGIGIY